MRANCDGHRCPSWCTTDHDELLVPGKPDFGYMDMHFSDPIAAREPMVKISLYPADTRPKIHVRNTFGTVDLELSVAQAETLAALLDLTGGDAHLLADEVRTAAGIALDATAGGGKS